MTVHQHTVTADISPPTRENIDTMTYAKYCNCDLMFFEIFQNLALSQFTCCPAVGIMPFLLSPKSLYATAPAPMLVLEDQSSSFWQPPSLRSSSLHETKATEKNKKHQDDGFESNCEQHISLKGIPSNYGWTPMFMSPTV